MPVKAASSHFQTQESIRTEKVDLQGPAELNEMHKDTPECG